MIARISCILCDGYDEIQGTFKNPCFNSNSIFDEFCMLKRRSYMMPLLKHALSLQNGLYSEPLSHLHIGLAFLMWSLMASTSHHGIAEIGHMICNSQQHKAHENPYDDSIQSIIFPDTSNTETAHIHV